ncbi:MAG: molybdopterin-synthase adenylyltransferase MoeB [Bacteroidetes bacterium]|nr:molybdopterin-synthase adenylyltransferase MoeB [Bacteroidota bacterium]
MGVQGSFSRYARHLVIPEIGAQGQDRLRRSSVVVIGAGGLGSPVLQYLAAAGVGTIGVVDDDVVAESNLQRQVIHRTDQIGRPKVETAAAYLRALNPDVTVRPVASRLTSMNAVEVLRPYDVIVDGSDNFPTRYLLSDAGVLLRKPVVYGSVYRFEGQVSVFDARRGPCYRCLYQTPPPPEMAPDCGDAGVLGVLPGLVGTIQAAETLKLLLGVGEPLIGRLLLVDGLAMEMRELRFKKDPACPVCSASPSITTLVDHEAFCATSQRQEDAAMVREMTVEELKERMDRQAPPSILDVREVDEHEFVNIGGTVIPVGELPERWKELDPSKEWVVYCRSGVRSANAVRFLQQQGFNDVKNLRGGILAWARTIDPTKPTY